MTLDYTKMFLIVTEEAVVKGHFACNPPHRAQIIPIFCYRPGRGVFLCPVYVSL